MTPFDAVLDRPSPAAAARLQTGGALRVLVADDERDVLESVRLLLGTHDIVTVTVSTPAEALAAATQPFDVALIDLNLERGHTSGALSLDLIAGLRKLQPTLPIVALAPASAHEVAREAMRRGVREFVHKPWDDARLVGQVRVQAELGRALRRVSELETEVRHLRSTGSPTDGSTQPLTAMRLLDVEGLLVREAMTKHHGNVSRAARSLGLSRSALYRRLERHQIEN